MWIVTLLVRFPVRGNSQPDRVVLEPRAYPALCPLQFLLQARDAQDDAGDRGRADRSPVDAARPRETAGPHEGRGGLNQGKAVRHETSGFASSRRLTGRGGPRNGSHGTLGEVVARVREAVVGLVAQHLKRTDRDNGDQSNDERVLDQALPGLVLDKLP